MNHDNFVCIQSIPFGLVPKISTSPSPVTGSSEITIVVSVSFCNSWMFFPPGPMNVPMSSFDILFGNILLFFLTVLDSDMPDDHRTYFSHFLWPSGVCYQTGWRRSSYQCKYDALKAIGESWCYLHTPAKTSRVHEGYPILYFQGTKIFPGWLHTVYPFVRDVLTLK